MSCLNVYEIRKLSMECEWYINKCISKEKYVIRSDVVLTFINPLTHIFSISIEKRIDFSINMKGKRNWLSPRNGKGVYIYILINNVDGIV